MTKPSSSTPRLLIVAAAVLWSLSALFVRLLQEPLGLGLDTPRIDPLVIAAYRSLFAGLMLLPFVPMADMRIRLPTAGAALCFGAMSGLYLMALGHGAAANAILLKYTAPLWVALATVALTGERLKLRNLAGVLVGVFGTAVIVVGNWPRDGHPADLSALLMALGSGVALAGVVLFLGSRHGQSPAWLNAAGLIGGAGVMAAFASPYDLLAPTARQFAWLVLFAAVQMAVPYRLFTHGLRHVRPQEAGILMLLEPVLTPIWIFALLPSHETPTTWTVVGGAVMLTALVVRYLPARAERT